jgi:hypothetical protein
MDFTILAGPTDIQIIATGRGIRELARVRRAYGDGRWRKMKGTALVRITLTGEITQREVHWYEAHGIGKREFKIKFKG